MHTRLWLLISLALAVSAAAAAAQFPFERAVDPGSATTTSVASGSDTVRGYAFQATEPVTVAKLGWSDAAVDGLVNAHEIGIYDGSGTLLASATVPSGTSAPLMDAFRWVDSRRCGSRPAATSSRRWPAASCTTRASRSFRTAGCRRAP